MSLEKQLKYNMVTEVYAKNISSIGVYASEPNKQQLGEKQLARKKYIIYECACADFQDGRLSRELQHTQTQQCLQRHTEQLQMIQFL